MDLRTYMAILWRHKSVLVITTVCALLISAVGTQFIETRYRATTTVRLMTATRGSTEWVDYDLRYADRLMNTYAQVARSASVRNQLMTDLVLREVPVVVVDIVANTELMKISVDHTDGALAADAANYVAAILIRDGAQAATDAAQNTQNVITTAITAAELELNTARSNYERLRLELGDETAAPVIAAARTADLAEMAYETLVEQYQSSRIRDALQMPVLTVLDRAVAPTQPFQPRFFLILGLGLVFGFAGGLVLVFLFEHMNPQEALRQQWQPSRVLPEPNFQTALPMLTASHNGQYGRRDDHHAEADQNGVYQNGHQNGNGAGRRDEQQPWSFGQPTAQQLVETIWNRVDHGELPRSILIAGVAPFAERTQLAVDFAVTLVESGRKVVLLDCDFWEPALHRFFALPNETGLSNLLLQQSSLGESIWYSRASGVHVIPTGPKPHQPEQLITASAMGIVLNILTMQFDVVIINAPVLSKVADTVGVARYVDGVILSAENERRWQRHGLHAQQKLSHVNVPLLGILCPQWLSTSDAVPQRFPTRNGVRRGAQPISRVEYSQQW